MFWRTFIFSLILLVGVLVGEALLPLKNYWESAFISLLVTCFVLYLFDINRASKTLSWLRGGDLQTPPFLRGVWGEVGDRILRLVKSHERETVKSNARLTEFLAAIQASPHGVLLINPEGRIEWSNAMAKVHLGIDLQRDKDQLIGNLVRDPAYTTYAHSLVYDHEVVIDGVQSQFQNYSKISLQLFPYGDGHKLMLTRDITALEQAEMMRRDFVANVSHEIRTPLTVLAGFVETMQNLCLEPEEQTRYLALMQQQASRMQILVQDLLTLSKLEGSPLPSALDWFALEGVIKSCEVEARGLSSTLLQDQHSPHELIFEYEGPKEGVEISGNKAEIQSAMSNLISNALRYTPLGAQVRVSCSVLETGEWRFAVKDNGVGIAPEHIPRLTERFYRVDRSRSRETGGTGLGLAIVKHVIQRHGGEMDIQSALGKGSEFSWVLPKTRVRVLEASDLHTLVD
jgi:two-component system phosphate regulon sensor histidine kinase PhoR